MGAAQSSTQDYSKALAYCFAGACIRYAKLARIEFDAGIFSLRPSVDTISRLTQYRTLHGRSPRVARAKPREPNQSILIN